MQLDRFHCTPKRLALQPFAQEIEEAARIAMHLRALDAQRAWCLAPMPQLPAHLARAGRARLQEGAQLQQLPPRCEQQRLGIADRLGEMQHRPELCGRLVIRTWVGAVTKGSIEIIGECAAEAPCQPRARQTQDIA